MAPKKKPRPRRAAAAEPQPAQSDPGAAPAAPGTPNPADMALGGAFHPDNASGDVAGASEALAQAAQVEAFPETGSAAPAAPAGSAGKRSHKKKPEGTVSGTPGQQRYWSRRKKEPGEAAAPAAEGATGREYKTRADLLRENEILQGQIQTLQPSPEGQLEKLTASIETVSRAGFEILSRFRGPHWALRPAEARQLAEAAAPCIEPYMGELEEYSPWLALVAVTALIVLPRMDEDRREKLRRGGNIEMTPSPAGPGSPAGSGFVPVSHLEPRPNEPAAAPTVMPAAE